MSANNPTDVKLPQTSAEAATETAARVAAIAKPSEQLLRDVELLRKFKEPLKGGLLLFGLELHAILKKAVSEPRSYAQSEPRLDRFRERINQDFESVLTDKEHEAYITRCTGDGTEQARFLFAQDAVASARTGKGHHLVWDSFVCTEWKRLSFEITSWYQERAFKAGLFEDMNGCEPFQVPIGGLPTDYKRDMQREDDADQAERLLKQGQQRITGFDVLVWSRPGWAINGLKTIWDHLVPKDKQAFELRAYTAQSLANGMDVSDEHAHSLLSKRSVPERDVLEEPRAKKPKTG